MDPEYEFCPAAHRKQLLNIMTRHFCCHPFFPTHKGKHQTSDEIHKECVHKMYTFCMK